MSPWETLLRRAVGGMETSALVLDRHLLRKYQRVSIQLMKNTLEADKPSGLILALEPGAGKTVSFLTAADDLLKAGRVKKVLIIAPLLVANTVWSAEIEDWLHLRHLTYSICTGTEKQRIAALNKEAQVYIINKDVLPWLWDHLGRGERWDFDFVGIDEASMLKNGKKRTKLKKLTRFGVLAAARKHMKGVVELTGTPSPNGLVNLWGLSYIADQGERLGRTKTAFMTRWFDVNSYSYEVKAKPHAEQQIMSAIGDIMFSLDPDDYAELPPMVANEIRVKLPPKVMEEYRRFKRTLVSEAYDVEAVNAAVLTNKLLQFCIAKDTEVLTGRGWIAIQDVLNTDVVWDGVEWVTQKGSVYKGNKAVVPCYGVNMTIDHKVLTVAGWREAGEVIYGDAGVRFDRAQVRIPDGTVATRNHRREDEKSHLDVPMRLRNARSPYQPEPSLSGETSPRCNAELRLQTWRDSSRGQGRSRDDGGAPLGHLAADAESLSQSRGEGFPQLRRERHHYAGLLVQFVRGFLGGCKARIRRRFDLGPQGQQQRIFQGELPLGLEQGSVAQYAGERDHRNSLGKDDHRRGGGTRRPQICDAMAALPNERVARRSAVRSIGTVEVYDLIDCGPRHRFVVRGSDGPVIVHNCNGSMFQEDGNDIWVHDCKLDALENLHNEVGGTPMLVAYSFKFDKRRIKEKFKHAVILNEVPDVMKTVRDWNAGKIDMLLAHPASAAHGLNIQKGSNISVWYGLNSDLELFQQFNKRLHRPGQKADRVWSHRIIAEATHDEDILPILSDKKAVQDRVFEATRLVLGNYNA